jgi:iron complex outermembrane recepter protein
MSRAHTLCRLCPLIGLAVAMTATGASAQTQLEGIVVSAPTPVASTPAPAQAPEPVTTPDPETTTPSTVTGVDILPGTLIVVDDAFVPVTVVTERDILADSGANIADALDTKPGIIGSTFAPGANRPIIRGLDSYRVRVQSDGIGSQDVSALSEDHAVPIDPFLATQVEVIRGPATLRYGSQAIGGVVAVETNRIPTVVPQGGFAGQMKGDLTSVDEGRNGAFQATAGARGMVVYGDGFRRRTDDYDTPRGTEFNTFADAEGGAVGTSFVGTDGFVGVSLSRYQSFYGIPGEEALELQPRIDLEQNRLQSKGEYRVGGMGIEAIRYWFGMSEYAHNEVVDEGEGDEIGSRFTVEAYETRVELQHLPIMTSLGRFRGAVGTQIIDRNVRGQSFEGDSLLEPSRTQSVAAFWFEELDVRPDVTLQAAARIEHSDIDGFGRLEPLNPDVPLVGLNRNYTPFSASVGGLYRLHDGSVFSLNTQYVERAPDAAELFSAGIHEATGTFEIGNPDLVKEKAATIELGYRKSSGRFRYDTTAYFTYFDGFIFRQFTGLECEGTLASCGEEEGHEEEEHEEEGHEHEALDQVLFEQRNATFTGVELAAQYDVRQVWRGVWGIDGQFDYVRARFTDGGNVPRIPPARLGGGVYYRDDNWFARTGVLHAFDQNFFGENEIATPGYTLVSAELAYRIKLDRVAGLGPSMTIGLKGQNLADDEVLNSASFKRRENVLLPGANVRLFGSIKLN